MALQRPNMVAPTGKLFRSTCRGSLMGNRGPLLDSDGNVQREFAHQRWITCTLKEVHGRRVQFDDPTRYTPLFFTDEAVALAAGHRPCGSCRPEAYQRFVAAWRRYKGWPANRLFRAAQMDRELHPYRTRDAVGRGIRASVTDLPSGCFIWGENRECLLLLENALLPWSPARYGEPRKRPLSGALVTITPAPMVEVLRSGYDFDAPALPRSVQAGETQK